MKLLVTGGAGFIGSNFIRYWLKKHPEDKIINLDKLTYAGHLSTTKDFSKDKNYKFIKGDITDSKIVDKATKGIDYVVHFAAESHVDRSLLDPEIFVKTNVLGTNVLLQSSVKNGVKRFHHISTDEVFGTLELGGNDKFNDSSLYNPRSAYAASKASSDHFVRAYFNSYGLAVTITNCSNNYGPFQDPEKFIPRSITNLLENKPIPIYGEGQQVRDWLYVEDHVRAIESVLKDGKVGETYLVGGQTDGITNMEVAKALLDIFGKDESHIKHVKDRPGHDVRYAIDWSKIKSELGWEPLFGFKDWLLRTVNWYKENEWWWKPLKNTSEKLYKKTGQS